MAFKSSKEASENIDLLITEYNKNISTFTETQRNLNSTLNSVNVPLVDLPKMSLPHDPTERFLPVHIPYGLDITMRNATDIPFIVENWRVNIYYGDEEIFNESTSSTFGTGSIRKILTPNEEYTKQTEAPFKFYDCLQGRLDHSAEAGPPYLNFKTSATFITTGGKKYQYFNHSEIYFKLDSIRKRPTERIRSATLDEYVRLLK